MSARPGSSQEPYPESAIICVVVLCLNSEMPQNTKLIIMICKPPQYFRQAYQQPPLQLNAPSFQYQVTLPTPIFIHQTPLSILSTHRSRLGYVSPYSEWHLGVLGPNVSTLSVFWCNRRLAVVAWRGNYREQAGRRDKPARKLRPTCAPKKQYICTGGKVGMILFVLLGMHSINTPCLMTT